MPESKTYAEADAEVQRLLAERDAIHREERKLEQRLFELRQRLAKAVEERARLAR